MIKSLLNFVKDERGAETVEFGISSIVIAGGAVEGLSGIKNKMQAKQTDMVDSLDDATT